MTSEQIGLANEKLAKSASVRVGDREAFSWGGLAGIGGATAAVTVLTGTLSGAFAWQYPKWIPLLIALVIVVAADCTVRKATAPSSFRDPARYILWLLNACLVFTTAVGGTHLVVGSAGGPQGSEAVVAHSSPRAPSSMGSPWIPVPSEVATDPAGPVPASEARPGPPRSETARHPATPTAANVPHPAPSTAATEAREPSSPGPAAPAGSRSSSAPSAAAPAPRLEFKGFRRLDDLRF